MAGPADQWPPPIEAARSRITIPLEGSPSHALHAAAYKLPLGHPWAAHYALPDKGDRGAECLRETVST
jgi:hypothetical protein